MSDFDDEAFRQFIFSLFRRGKVRENDINAILTPKVMAEFKIAFTHPSAGAERDYQLYEFLGDVVFNEFVPFYLRFRFPKIVSVKWITRLKHTLVGKKYLAMLARNEGIDKFAIYGDLPFSNTHGRCLVGMREEIKQNPDLNSNMHYLSMLEDIMEAFLGCLVTVITDPVSEGGFGKVHGVATEIAKNILESFFSNVEIATRYDQVFDAVSRLKELYESRARGYKWPNKEAFEYEKLADGKYTTIVYGWPKGDKTPIPANRLKLASATNINKDESKRLAAEKALRVLSTTWGIEEIPLNPYEK